MSEEKAEALRQISEIKNHLVDKQTFYPYNYHAVYIWSLVSLVLTLSMVNMYEISIGIGTAVVFILIAIGFITEGMLTKKVNERYDIEDCTLRQQFLMMSFLMMSLFMIVISAVLATYKLYVPIYLMWLFMVSLVYFSVGFVLNIQRFTKMSLFNMLSAIVLLSIGFLNNTFVGSDITYIRIVQVFMILGLVIMPAMVAWQQIRDGK